MSLKREVTILNSQGMHARPAMQVMKTSSRFQSTIKIHKGNQQVDARASWKS